jgi:RHS repeat-associated protein
LFPPSRDCALTTAYTYDPIGRLATLTQGFATSTNNVTWTYGYDVANGQVTRSATNDAYTSHPPVQSQTYATNGLNQYAAVSGATYTYDGRGNLASDGTRAFTYDIDNHLLTGSAPTAATFTYDPFGRRWTDTGPTYFVPFIYDGPNLAMEYYSGAVLRRYVPSGLGVDQPLVWYEGAGTGTPRWLQADNLGSVVAYSDASGNQHFTTGYGPFGEVPNFYSTRYEYTGQLNIPELSLFDFKARAYDPNLGRFLSADPAGYASDINSYAYVGNDPVNGTDPSGMTDIPEDLKLKEDIIPFPHWIFMNPSFDIPPVCTSCDLDSNPVFGAGAGANSGSAASDGGGTQVAGVTVTANKSQFDAGPHHYLLSLATGCTPDEAMADLTSPNMSAPGAGRAQAGGPHRVILLGNNPIDQTVDFKAHTILNVTDFGHMFYFGSVFISTVAMEGGGSKTTIEGNGIGPNKTFNLLFGDTYFGNVLKVLQIDCLIPQAIRG